MHHNHNHNQHHNHHNQHHNHHHNLPLLHSAGKGELKIKIKVRNESPSVHHHRHRRHCLHNYHHCTHHDQRMHCIIPFILFYSFLYLMENFLLWTVNIREVLSVSCYSSLIMLHRIFLHICVEVMISYPRPWLCAAGNVFDCGSRIWFLIRVHICDNFSFCCSRLQSFIKSGLTPQILLEEEASFLALKLSRPKKDSTHPDVCSLQTKPVCQLNFPHGFGRKNHINIALLDLRKH